MLRPAARRLGGFAALALAVPCWCADLQVSPILLQFTATDKAQALWLTNTGARPVAAQVRAYAWTQMEDEDHLDPTQALVASPPLVNVAPGQSQLVRIVRRPAPASTREEGFRLIVDELPLADEAPATDAPPATEAGRNGLRLLLRYSIPAFVGSDGGAQRPDAKQVAAAWTPGEHPLLTISNQWTRRLRITTVVHEDAAGRRTVIVPGLLGYVLAGQKRRFALPAAAQDLGPGVIKARLYEALEEFPLATVARGS